MVELPTIHAEVLGPLRVVGSGGRTLGAQGQRQQRLLALFVLRRGEVVTADEAVEALWPEELPRDPAAALQTHVFRLRRGLPAGALEWVGTGYRLDRDAVTVDADDLVAALERAAARRAADPEAAIAELDAALGRWRGRPYPELADTEGGRREADRLVDVHARAREERAEAVLAAGRAAEVVSELRALAEDHPLRERPRSLLMTALAATGRAADALRVYDDVRRLLATELGIEPSLALRRQHAELLDGGGPAPATAPVGSRLPLPPTSLVGRDELIAAAVRLATDQRVVTMLGPGGVGKTRVLLEVGRRLAGSGALGRVVLCELASSSADTAVEVVGAALDIDPRDDRPSIERIVGMVGDEPVVVLLDNCEHVLDPVAALVDRLVAACPGVRVVATSRERLRVSGEHLCPVPPLPLTAGDGPAAQLFVERARAVRPDFAPDDAAWTVVAEIVRRLDGLPLAIELAAARLHTTDLGDIASGLGRRFRLLATGSRASHRHRSLSAAVAWSYDLLDPELRRLFTVVSVFVTPFGAVDAATVAGIDVDRAVDGLADLAERSLVGRVADGRFELLETLRAFGVEQLEASGDGDTIRGRHAHHVVRWLERVTDGRHGDGGASMLAEVEARLPEVRAAGQWLLDHEDVGRAGRLATALHDFGLYRLRPDVLAFAERVAEADPDDRGTHAAQVWAVASVESWMRGDVEELGVRAARARAICARAGASCPPVVATVSGNHALFEGRLADAVAWYRVARDVTDDPAWLLFVAATDVLARAYGGDPSSASAAEEVLVEAGERTGPHAALAWYAAGEAELGGDVTVARFRLHHAVEMAERVGATFVSGIAGATLASIEAVHGDALQAAVAYRGLIDQWRRAGMWSTQWTMLRAIALLLERLGRHRDAAVLAGAVLSTSEGHRLFGDDEVTMTALTARLRGVLGDEAFEMAASDGAALDGEAAAEHALRSL